MNQSERQLYLIKYLLAEEERYEKMPVPESEDERFRLLRSLMNLRPPKPISEEFLDVQDEFLKEMISSKSITDIDGMKPIEQGIYLWRGDITTLKCGAIVNAANSQMLGCFQPCHGCIDNAIHTFAGIGLRLECAKIMSEQGFEEPTGTAKITGSYNLPCGHIIHTVGPVVSGALTDRHCRQLESCYRSCLEIAALNDVKSIAFCCISTGVFGFPQKEAAEIAVNTVRNFIKSCDIEVIFNVFTEKDYAIYNGLLG
ncbi:MAG: protein-ADP-ribose hydrolase [Oscillospiraceae bacterium]|nr:protein-ADP-ribose hydrolase [Oscillospiraceae bacterium]